MDRKVTWIRASWLVRWPIALTIWYLALVGGTMVGLEWGKMVQNLDHAKSLTKWRAP